MRKFFFIVLLFPPVFAMAREYDGYVIKNIRVNTRRMAPEVLQKKFKLKPGDIFDSAKYEKAQNDLHNMRVCKELEFGVSPDEDGSVDITVDAADGYFIFPLVLFTGGGKGAASLSLVAGNIFKQGETAMLFTAFSEDGYAAAFGLGAGESSFSVRASELDFEQRFYGGGWSGNYGVLSTAKDKGLYGAPLWETDSKKNDIAFAYAYKKDGWTFSVSPQYRRVSYSPGTPPADDDGSHNALTIGVSLSENMPQGANMGAVFGYGLTDKTKALSDLPAVKRGYSLGVNYTGGGAWTGADYNINKVAAAASFLTEFKRRHVLLFSLRAQDAFNPSFSDQIRSVELMERNGTYNRQILGGRGAGFSASFTYYLLRDNLGLLAAEPFYQAAFIERGNKFFNHGGAGAGIFYKFWRFPLPLGLTYTHNLSDGSDAVSFYAGASF